MLFEGAKQALANAKFHMQQNEIAEKGIMLSKAIMIIDHGLKASLDTNVGGEMALNLYNLYEYMTSRLIVANVQNDVEIINEVNKLLSELHGAWEAIGKDNTLAPISQTTANQTS
jgi:flagellar protein FliS